MSKPRIYLVDVTNRDGVQTARVNLAKLEKTIVNLMLDEVGVFQGEIGFPFTGHELNYIKANTELAKKGAFKRMRLEGWCRGIIDDVDKAVKHTDLEHLALSISTSDIMIEKKFRGKMGRAEVLKSAEDSCKYALENGVKTATVNSEDASRTDIGFLKEFAATAKAAGAVRVRYCDTLGCESPQNIYNRIHEVASEVGISMEMHCHNDLGMVVANSVMGALGCIDAGYDAFIDVTVNGLGERAGNADLLSTVLALKYSAGLEGRDVLDPEVVLGHSWKLANYFSEATGLPIPINQVGVGANAFAHESGIHADGALKDRKNYELYDYEELGRGDPCVSHTGRIITTGEYGGAAGLKKVYEDIGLELTDNDQTRELLRLCQYANLHTQKPLNEAELRFIYTYPEETELLLTVDPTL